MSLVLDTAAAVTEALNTAPDGTFPLAFTAERRVMVTSSLEGLENLRVSVVPRSLEITGATRSAHQHDVAIDIGIQKKLNGGDDALTDQVAELCGLVDSMAAYLRKRLLPEVNGQVPGAWTKTENDPVYAADHLAMQRVFTSVLTVTYRSLK